MTLRSKYGAGGGTRTHTSVTPKDFESSSSTIPTHRQIYFSTPRQAFPGIWGDMQEGCERQMKNRSRKTLDFPGLFPTPATDGEVVFESTTSTIPSHRRHPYSIAHPGEKCKQKVSGKPVRTPLVSPRNPSGLAAMLLITPLPPRCTNPSRNRPGCAGARHSRCPGTGAAAGYRRSGPRRKGSGYGRRISW